VAVALPEPYSTTLANARRATGDKHADDMTPHVTLVPPVQVSEPLDHIVEFLQGCAKATEPFVLHLRGTGTFRPVSQVVFVAVTKGISELELLTERLRIPPLDPPALFPYHPHVTVAQEVEERILDAIYEELADFRATLTVTSFQLYEANGGSTARLWVPILDLPLGA
jgi:2'-5' RNA ligase